MEKTNIYFAIINSVRNELIKSIIKLLYDESVRKRNLLYKPESSTYFWKFTFEYNGKLYAVKKAEAKPPHCDKNPDIIINLCFNTKIPRRKFGKEKYIGVSEINDKKTLLTMDNKKVIFHKIFDFNKFYNECVKKINKPLYKYVFSNPDYIEYYSEDKDDSISNKEKPNLDILLASQKHGYVKQTIEESNVHFSHPEVLNDLYDGSNYLLSLYYFLIRKFSKEKKRIKKIYEILVEDNNLDCFNFENVKSKFEDVTKEKDNSLYNIIENEINSYQKNRLNILSLTEDNSNILMWAHYANSYKGLCITYSIEEIKKFIKKLKDEKINILISNVVYSYELPSYMTISGLELFIEDNTYNNIIEILLSFFKFKVWKYEKEYRIIILGESDKDYDLVLKPSEITFGPSWTEDQINKFKQNYDYRDIKLKRAKKNKNDYKIEIVE